MQKKLIEKEKAIQLRREGKTYSQIMKVVPVAKSTISLWLKEIGLSVPQQQNITAARIAAAKRGGEAKRRQRIIRTESLYAQSRCEIGSLTEKEKFLIGVALYWAEGTKQKMNNISEQVCFGNSDPHMIKCFLGWLGLLKIPKTDVTFSLYIHTTGDVENAIQFWSGIIEQRPDILKQRVYFKKGNPKTNRYNIGARYVGLLRVEVKRSTDLNRKVFGWTQGIIRGYI